MTTTLKPGDLVRCNKSLHAIPVRHDDWESFSPGVKRHRFRNELRATRDIPRNELVTERTFSPDELIGIVHYEDILTPGQFSICWYPVEAMTGTTAMKLANSELNCSLELGGKWWTPEEVTVLRSLPTPVSGYTEIIDLINLVRASENS